MIERLLLTRLGLDLNLIISFYIDLSVIHVHRLALALAKYLQIVDNYKIYTQIYL